MDKKTNHNTIAAPRIIVSGGGTGGHIFPAISIANALKELCPDADILFVGAEGRMEMQRVPDAGYRIIGLPVAGFDRQHLWKNVAVLVKLLRSQLKARRIVRDFRPQVAVGVGGTNKLLAKQAAKICVAYEGMERFFPADKIILTGNPVRQNLRDNRATRAEGAAHFGLDPQKKTILVLGGSLGARTLNRTMEAGLRTILGHPEVQFIWQTGKIYIDEVKQAITAFTGEAVRNVRVASLPNLFVSDFIKHMDLAYAAADLVVSRAGAGSISEFCLLGKPVILVPSPNVAEDHQTKNALALAQKDAALYVKDADAPQQLLDTALQAVADNARLQSLAGNIGRLALPDAANTIAREVLGLIGGKEDRQ